ncbi:hypothetical protein GCM10010521_46680 [Streptomyces rameus]|uniref:Uncharacterized protein n=1 Tax=Streptomyces rameus TaxID=68261 RepID=A0ABP6NPQ6_9ACTN
MSVTIREPGVQVQSQVEVGQDLYVFVPHPVRVPPAKAPRRLLRNLAQWKGNEGNVLVPASVVHVMAGARRASA